MNGEQADPKETIEETSQALMKQVMEKGGVLDDTVITMSGKQLNTLVVAVSAATAEVYTQTLNKLTDNFKEEMKLYVSNEFLDEFKNIDGVIDALGRIDKLERSFEIHTRYLDKHERLLKSED